MHSYGVGHISLTSAARSSSYSGLSSANVTDGFIASRAYEFEWAGIDWDRLGADFSFLAFGCDGIIFHSVVACLLSFSALSATSFILGTDRHFCCVSSFQAHFVNRLFTASLSWGRLYSFFPACAYALRCCIHFCLRAAWRPMNRIYRILPAGALRPSLWPDICWLLYSCSFLPLLPPGWICLFYWIFNWFHAPQGVAWSGVPNELLIWLECRSDEVDSLCYWYLYLIDNFYMLNGDVYSNRRTRRGLARLPLLAWCWLLPSIITNVRCVWMTCELWYYHRALLPFIIWLLYNKHTFRITYIRVQVVFLLNHGCGLLSQ